MKYAIVYSSQTGNTKQLADAIKSVLPNNDCIYFGKPNVEALKAERIYVGFWTDKGTCDKDTAKFLKDITNQEIYLFGTAGFGGNKEYFDKVINKATNNLNKNAHLIGYYMCQGKMPISVRNRYEKMLQSPVKIPNIQNMIDNFDKALTHPDSSDIENLKNEIKKII